MGKSAKGQRSATDDPNAFAEAVASIAKLVADEGAIAKSALAKHGVPRARVAFALEQLAASGLEVTSKFVRVPLAQQLAAQLSSAGLLPLRSIESYVHGANKREATAAASELVTANGARFVVRSTELLLASSETAALDDRDLDRLETATATLAAAVKLARRKGGTLLRADVEQALRAFVPVPTAPTAPTAPSATKASPLQSIRASIDAHRETSGLTWVPKLVRALGGLPARDAVHAELLRGARAGELELRPESGMGRLSEEDAALCLAGPQGSRLSWVRPIGMEEKS